jgi:hypothetical protein
LGELTKGRQQSAFCTNKGAEVRDKTVFSVYIGLQSTENVRMICYLILHIDGHDTDGDKQEKEGDDETSGDNGDATATVAKNPKAKPNEYDVYLITKPKKKREAPEKGFLSDRLGVSVDVR